MMACAAILGVSATQVNDVCDLTAFTYTLHIFLALAKDVPDPQGGQKLVPNPYKTWKDVNSSLPAKK
jgi:hypothetical protein